MKRLRLASKLSLAIVPIGLVALLAGGFVAWTFFQRTTAQEQASRVAATGVEAMTTLRNIWSEEQAVAFGTVSMGAVHGAVDTAVARLKAAGATLDPTTAAGSEMIATIAQVETALAQARSQTASYDLVNDLILSLVSEATFTFEDVEEAVTSPPLLPWLKRLESPFDRSSCSGFPPTSTPSKTTWLPMKRVSTTGSAGR